VSCRVRYKNNNSKCNNKLNTFHYLLSICYLNVILSVYICTMHIFNIHSDKHLRIWQKNNLTADNLKYVV